MRIISLITLIFIVFCSYRQTQPEIITWSPNRLLTWNDFKGVPDVNKKHSAITDCNIDWNLKTIKDSLFVNIKANVQPNKSWVKLKAMTKDLLKHEQVHFDITELFARKLRHLVLNSKFPKTGVGNELKKMSFNNTIAFKKYQSLYDSLTNHSLIKAKQLEWEKKIVKELKELDAYSNTDLKILLK